MTDFINGFFSFLYDGFTWLLDGLLYVLKAAFYFPFDGLLTAIEGMFTVVDFSGVLFDSAGTWAGLPAPAIYCMDQMGFPLAAAIVVSAYTVRLLLNFIPSWATRV
ncbi:hypothetical protein KAR91_40570 [Candidatus Pacearchaeota archaeon]|nr:hypothetical protein [Candidatus Pacearchaeota archaeon]